MAKMALINYYARLLQKKSIREEEIPEELREAVHEAMEKLPPVHEDRETHTLVQ